MSHPEPGTHSESKDVSTHPNYWGYEANGDLCSFDKAPISDYGGGSGASANTSIYNSNICTSGVEASVAEASAHFPGAGEKRGECWSEKRLHHNSKKGKDPVENGDLVLGEAELVHDEVADKPQQALHGMLHYPPSQPGQLAHKVVPAEMVTAIHPLVVEATGTTQPEQPAAGVVDLSRSH